MLRQQTSSQPVEIARQAADAATAAAASAGEAARALVANVDLDDVRDTVTDVRDTVSDELNKDVELVLDQTRRRPLLGLLIALGLGTLIGIALDRAARRRKPAAPPPMKPAM